VSKLVTPFGFGSTTSDVLQGVDLSGKTALVTGANSGIGYETARALASAGAAVVVAARHDRAGSGAAAQIAASTGNPHVWHILLDLADLDSVARAAAGWSGPLEQRGPGCPQQMKPPPPRRANKRIGMKLMMMRGQHHATGENTLAVMSPPPADAPPAVAAEAELRLIANATGLCPGCGATIPAPNRHARRAAAATGAMVRASMVHEPGCVCSDEAIKRLYIAGSN
jgi:hypothetical protein